jgi:polyhydroxyalkanoate synthesis regulator phasin
MTMTELKEYIEEMYRTAESLWGQEEAEKIRQHIESTASAVYRVGKIELSTETEPVTKLRHREKP